MTTAMAIIVNLERLLSEITYRRGASIWRSKEYIRILTLLPVLILRAINIEKYYGPRRILRNVNLNVAQGEIALIEGSSGNGKTTLLNILSGIDLPDRGSVIFQGTDITKLSEDERAKLRLENIGIVFQVSALIDDLNVMENIALPLKLAGKKWKERVKELVKYFNIEHIKHSFPNALSGGEKQRVEIARALANNPKILIADEPTSNLDDANALRVAQLIIRIREELNTTVVIASHDLRIKNLGDKKYILEKGVLHER